MALDWKNLIAVSGLHVAGDVGPLTVYTRRNGMRVFFPRSPPTRPPSVKQVTQRNLWRLVASDWKMLSTNDRAQWEKISIDSHIPMTGYNLFMTVELTKHAQRVLPTLIHQANMTSTPPFTDRSAGV